MKKLLLFIPLCWAGWVFDGHAQIMQVIASSGGSGQGGGTSMTWTLGEPAVATMTPGNMMFTPGFHQPVLIASAVSSNEGIPFTIEVYPNPSRDFIVIQLHDVGFQEFKYLLFDAGGRLLYQINPDKAVTCIDLGKYTSGMYLLKTLQAEKEISTFEIIKQ